MEVLSREDLNQIDERASAPPKIDEGAHDGPIHGNIGAIQHERYYLWIALRYLPFVFGAGVATVFGASVYWDPADVAHASFASGGDLLGTFGHLSRLLITPVFAISALLRRGSRRSFRVIRLDRDGLVAEDEHGRWFEIPRSAVRSSFVYRNSDGTRSVVLELGRALSIGSWPGDRLTLSVDAECAATIQQTFATEETRVPLTTRSTTFGGAVSAWSLAVGTLIGMLFFRSIWHVALGLPQAPYYVALGPEAELGWLTGLAMAAIGMVHALTSLALRPPQVVLGSEAIRIGGLFAKEIPYSSVVSVETRGAKLRLVLEDDTHVEYFWPASEPAKLAGLPPSWARRSPRAARRSGCRRDWREETKRCRAGGERSSSAPPPPTTGRRPSTRRRWSPACARPRFRVTCASLLPSLSRRGSDWLRRSARNRRHACWRSPTRSLSPACGD